MKTVLTIAGSDCSGGAGIQADLKTFAAHGLYGMSVVTALTAQNTTGVYGVLDAGAEFTAKQLDCIFTDIFPDAVKIGMVSSAGIIHAIVDKLRQYRAENVVVDPVMVSTSGSKLISDDAKAALLTALVPMADIITPNIPEAEVLSGLSIQNREDMLCAAEKIGFSGYTLIKGGHLEGVAADLLYKDGIAVWLEGERIDTKNTHGTGCTLSSAIACGLAAGQDMETAVQHAKDYVTGALKAGLQLGHGNGPLDHGWRARD